MPALRQPVQTSMRTGVPLAVRVRTRWMFTSNRRLVRRCECEIVLPKPGPLPQISQVAATVELLVWGMD